MGLYRLGRPIDDEHALEMVIAADIEAAGGAEAGFRGAVRVPREDEGDAFRVIATHGAPGNYPALTINAQTVEVTCHGPQ